MGKNEKGGVCVREKDREREREREIYAITHQKHLKQNFVFQI